MIVGLVLRLKSCGDDTASLRGAACGMEWVRLPSPKTTENISFCFFLIAIPPPSVTLVPASLNQFLKKIENQRIVGMNLFEHTEIYYVSRVYKSFQSTRPWSNLLGQLCHVLYTWQIANFLLPNTHSSALPSNSCIIMCVTFPWYSSTIYPTLYPQHNAERRIW